MYGLLVFCLLSWWYKLGYADITVEIDRGVVGAIPIAVVPFKWYGAALSPPEDVSAVVIADLTRSSRFSVLPEQEMLSRPTLGGDIDFRDWRALAQDALVLGDVTPEGAGYVVQFQLLDVPKKEQIAAYRLPTTKDGLRTTAHWIANFIYEKFTGMPGGFTTRIAYIAEERSADNNVVVAVKVADVDGHNPQTVLSSNEPLMSPTWSPDGWQLAYVSFENKQQSIYIQDLSTGKRRQIAAHPGINSAPAWSPDGLRLAMVLSKDGDPEIYVLELKTNVLTRITDNIAIDTEPAWSPNGRYITFTSDRGGSPQLYVVTATGGDPERLTFDGDYSAAPTYAPDGKTIALVTMVDDKLKIALLNLATKTIQELTDGPLDKSPSFIAGGGMIVYSTKFGGHNRLAAVSTDGKIKYAITTDGEARQPVCSQLLNQNK